MAVLDDLNMLVRNGKMTRNEARAAYPRRWYDSTAFPECVLTIKHFPERGEDLHKGLMEDCQTWRVAVPMTPPPIIPAGDVRPLLPFRPDALRVVRDVPAGCEAALAALAAS